MEQGISQVELGRRLGLTSTATMSLRETGNRDGSFDEIQRWAAELGVAVEALDEEEWEFIMGLRELLPDQREKMLRLMRLALELAEK